MITDPLTPEDRALHDSFFEAYREKYNELAAAAGDGAEISLDACTVHAIKVMTAIDIAKLRDAIAPSLKMLVVQAAECFPEVNERGQKHFVRVVMESAAEELQEVLAPAPRIVSAVGVGVRVKPPEGAGNICKWVELPELAAFNEVGQQWRTACGHNVAGLAEAALPALCPFCKGVVE